MTSSLSSISSSYSSSSSSRSSSSCFSGIKKKATAKLKNNDENLTTIPHHLRTTDIFNLTASYFSVIDCATLNCTSRGLKGKAEVYIWKPVALQMQVQNFVKKDQGYKQAIYTALKGDFLACTRFHAFISNIDCNFKIISSPNYKPSSFDQTSQCPITTSSFNELVKDHYKTYEFPYFAALVEDDRNCNSLYDLTSLTTWYASKNWSSEAFTNCISKATCRRISLYAVTKFGAFACGSVRSFKDFRYYFEDFADLKRFSNFFKEKGSIAFLESRLAKAALRNDLYFSDEEILNWIKCQIVTSMEIFNFAPVFRFINRGNPDRAHLLLENIAEKLQIEQMPSRAEKNPELFIFLLFWFQEQNTYDIEKSVYCLEKIKENYSRILERKNTIKGIFFREIDINRVEKKFLLDLVNFYFSHGNYIRALTPLHKLETIYRNSPLECLYNFLEVQSLLGEAYKILGDFGTAKKYFINNTLICYKSSKERNQYLFNLAEISRITKDYGQARFYLEEINKYIKSYFGYTKFIVKPFGIPIKKFDFVDRLKEEQAKLVLAENQNADLIDEEGEKISQDLSTTPSSQPPTHTPEKIKFTNKLTHQVGSFFFKNNPFKYNSCYRKTYRFCIICGEDRFPGGTWSRLNVENSLEDFTNCLKKSCKIKFHESSSVPSHFFYIETLGELSDVANSMSERQEHIPDLNEEYFSSIKEIK